MEYPFHTPVEYLFPRSSFLTIAQMSHGHICILETTRSLSWALCVSQDSYHGIILRNCTTEWYCGIIFSFFSFCLRDWTSANGQGNRWTSQRREAKSSTSWQKQEANKLCNKIFKQRNYILELYYRTISRNHITESYYETILRNHITESYYGIIWQNYITEVYHGIILRRYSTTDI